MPLGSTTIYVAPREDWGDDYYVRLYQTGGANVIDSNNGFVKADYDGSTGLYKATFSTTKTGSFTALIAKDTNHTDKVPSDGGGTGTLGTNSNYLFTHTLNTGGTALTAYSSQRCIWFIIGSGQSGIKSDISNYGDYMNIWDGADRRMRRINDNAYVYDYTTVPTGTIYFQQHYSGTGNRNEWQTTIPSDNSQFTTNGWSTGTWG